MNRISIFGLGYVGCVTAACFSDAGHSVIGVDLDPSKVNLINEGKSPIVEPGLGIVLANVVRSGRLRATCSGEEAINQSDIAFLCVGTPGNEHGQLQLDALRRCATQIGQALRGSTRSFTVVVRSTVLPGTTVKDVLEPLLEAAGEEFRPYLRIAVNPEFLREGTALVDFSNPPMTLIGADDPATVDQLKSVYALTDAPIVEATIENAEAVKYVSNTYHALKVCFANEMGDVLSKLGADAQEVMRIFRMDKSLNISEAYLRPGFAFGGSCLPKDVKALLYAAHHLDVSLPLLDAILPSNESQIQQAIDTVVALGERRIGVVGLAFKVDTDDLRGSPMVTLVEALIGKGCNVRILDDNVSIARLFGANKDYVVEEIPHISMLMCENVSSLIEHAQVLVLGCDSPDAKRVRERAKPGQIVIDLTRATRTQSPGVSVAA